MIDLAQLNVSYWRSTRQPIPLEHWADKLSRSWEARMPSLRAWRMSATDFCVTKNSSNKGLCTWLEQPSTFEKLQTGPTNCFAGQLHLGQWLASSASQEWIRQSFVLSRSYIFSCSQHKIVIVIWVICVYIYIVKFISDCVYFSMKYQILAMLRHEAAHHFNSPLLRGLTLRSGSMDKSPGVDWGFLELLWEYI